MQRKTRKILDLSNKNHKGIKLFNDRAEKEVAKYKKMGEYEL